MNTTRISCAAWACAVVRRLISQAARSQPELNQRRTQRTMDQQSWAVACGYALRTAKPAAAGSMQMQKATTLTGLYRWQPLSRDCTAGTGHARYLAVVLQHAAMPGEHVRPRVRTPAEAAAEARIDILKPLQQI